eukprot:g79349.t1
MKVLTNLNQAIRFAGFTIWLLIPTLATRNNISGKSPWNDLSACHISAFFFPLVCSENSLPAHNECFELDWSMRPGEDVGKVIHAGGDAEYMAKHTKGSAGKIADKPKSEIVGGTGPICEDCGAKNDVIQKFCQGCGKKRR